MPVLQNIKAYLQSDAVVDWIEQEYRQKRSSAQQVFIMAGAGDIDRLPAQIKERIES